MNHPPTPTNDTSRTRSDAGPRARRWPAVVLALAACAGVYAWLLRPAPRPEAFLTGLSLSQALARGDSASRPVLALATAQWCPACKAFARGGLTDPRVEAWVQDRAEAVYIDTDESPDQAAALDVRVLPTLVMLRDGREMARLEGSVSGAELLAWLDRAAGGSPERPGGVSPEGAAVIPGGS